MLCGSINAKNYKYLLPCCSYRLYGSDGAKAYPGGRAGGLKQIKIGHLKSKISFNICEKIDLPE